MAQIFRGILTCALLLLVGCSKNDNPPQHRPTYLLRSINWDNGLKATFSYSADSSIQHIAHTFGQASSQTTYKWSAGMLTELYDENSLYKNTYNYNNKEQLISVTTAVKLGTTSSSTSLEYKYHGNGKLDSLNHYIENEAGETLQNATGYHYGPAGELMKIVTKSGTHLITHTIAAYADETDFNPYIYIEPGLSENYSFYNLPVMKQIRSLPARIIRSVKPPNGTEYVERVEEHLYTVSERRITNVVTSISYPAMPQNNKTISADYVY